MLLLCSVFAGYVSAAQQEVTTQQLEMGLEKIGVTPFQVEFARFLRTLPPLPALKVKQQALRQHDVKVNKFVASGSCEKLALQRIKRRLTNLSQRVDLAIAYRQAPQEYQGTFRNLTNGQQWYRHWLNSWLEQEVTLNELVRIASDEAHQVNQHMQRLETSLPQEMTILSDTNEIIRQLRRREQTVRKHLSAVFNPVSSFVPFNIANSTMPESFPAPGYYVSENQTFYFHLHNQQFELKSADWLFLHEAVPGHHFQFSFPARTRCQTPSERPIFIAEGWGAYVETLGQQLGLFKNLHSKHYALEWQRLRAVRVLIDTGIHGFNWSDEQAWQTWQQYIPGQADIFRRELRRIKNWPAQVITYVYGKYMIERAIEGFLRHHPQRDLRHAHEALLNTMVFGADVLQADYPYWQLVADKNKE